MENRMLSGGGAVPEDESHREIDPRTGQQKGYVVLTPAERAKGFVRPVRRTYVHVGRLENQEFINDQHPSGVVQQWSTLVRKGGCGTETTCSTDIAETYARNPKFYSGTFCCRCRAHFSLDQFVWKGTEEQVGS